MFHLFLSQDTGLFGVYAVAEPENVERVVAHILNEFARLSDDVSDSEIATARTQLKTTLLSQLDGSTAVCEDIGRQVRHAVFTSTWPFLPPTPHTRPSYSRSDVG